MTTLQHMCVCSRPLPSLPSLSQCRDTLDTRRWLHLHHIGTFFWSKQDTCTVGSGGTRFRLRDALFLHSFRLSQCSGPRRPPTDVEGVLLTLTKEAYSSEIACSVRSEHLEENGMPVLGVRALGFKGCCKQILAPGRHSLAGLKIQGG